MPKLRVSFEPQYERFKDLTGKEPKVVNSHHHVQVFSLVGWALRAVLDRQNPKPYLRRIREPWRTIVAIRALARNCAFLNFLVAARPDGNALPDSLETITWQALPILPTYRIPIFLCAGRVRSREHWWN